MLLKKKRVMVLVLSTITLVSCSHMHDKIQDGKREIASAKIPCGLTGSIDERIKNCSYQESSESDIFVLVTRTKEFKEVYQDTRSGLLWGDRLPTTMDYDNAMKACTADLAEEGGVSGTWRLPSIEEYKEANINGVRKALPNMNNYWWSSSVYLDDVDYAWLFFGNGGGVDSVKRYNDFSVRCVGR